MTPNKRTRSEEKEAFAKALGDFVKCLGGYVSSDDGQWTVKGFIDIFNNIYLTMPLTPLNHGTKSQPLTTFVQSHPW